MLYLCNVKIKFYHYPFFGVGNNRYKNMNTYKFVTGVGGCYSGVFSAVDDTTAFMHVRHLLRVCYTECEKYWLWIKLDNGRYCLVSAGVNEFCKK